MAKASKQYAEVTSFRSIVQAEVPQGRNGKHKLIINRIVADLEQLPPGRALRIPLAELPDRKENIRSALNRVTRQLQMQVSTSSDDLHLYVWRSQAG